jgi:hypothetical protein
MNVIYRSTLKLKILVLLFCLISCLSFSQTITGTVLDAKTNSPIESASVYFDNTTIGTSTNNQGEFEIDSKDAANFNLIISFIGYETLTISERDSNKINEILLTPKTSQLDEVYISTYDGMPIKIKMEHFRKHFLGKSKNGMSSEILNEEDLILRYSKRKKQLIVRSRKRIRIKNNNLEYLVTYDLKGFTINYNYVNLYDEVFRATSVFYQGTSFFKDLNIEATKKVKKRRNITYKGSVLHFMRALSNQRLKKDRYAVYSYEHMIKPEEYISVKELESNELYEIKIRAPLVIKYNKKYETEIKPTSTVAQKKDINKTLTQSDSLELNLFLTPKKTAIPDAEFFNVEFFIDRFGNYSPIGGSFYFLGYMGNLRVGDALPLNYNLAEEEDEK